MPLCECLGGKYEHGSQETKNMCACVGGEFTFVWAARFFFIGRFPWLLFVRNLWFICVFVTFLSAPFSGTRFHSRNNFPLSLAVFRVMMIRNAKRARDFSQGVFPVRQDFPPFAVRRSEQFAWISRRRLSASCRRSAVLKAAGRTLVRFSFVGCQLPGPLSCLLLLVVGKADARKSSWPRKARSRALSRSRVFRHLPTDGVCLVFNDSICGV